MGGLWPKAAPRISAQKKNTPHFQGKKKKKNNQGPLAKSKAIPATFPAIRPGGTITNPPGGAIFKKIERGFKLPIGAFRPTKYFLPHHLSKKKKKKPGGLAVSGTSKKAFPPDSGTKREKGVNREFNGGDHS